MHITTGTYDVVCSLYEEATVDAQGLISFGITPIIV